MRFSRPITRNMSRHERYALYFESLRRGMELRHDWIGTYDPEKNWCKFYQVTLDIALRWSADAGRNRFLLTSHSAGVKGIIRNNTSSMPVIDRKMSVTC